MKKIFTLLLGIIFAGSVFAVSTITVVSPNGGENWLFGCPATIQWTTTIPVSVKIELYKGTALFMTICPQTSSTANSYTWTPAWYITPGSEYRVKITSLSTNVPDYDFSDANFAITAGTIAVTSPNGGETWQGGTTRTILWTSTLCDNVRIELWKGGVYNSLITHSTPSPSGSFTWTVPTTVLAGTDYKVKIMNAANAPGTITGVYDFSDANFAFTNPLVLTVLTPNGGENWTSGDTYQITWIDNITENVSIELWKGMAFKSVIATSASGPFNWTIPASVVPGSDYRVKIKGLTNVYAYDFSNSYFTISVGNYITVTSPNGGENWLFGCPVNIQWTTTIPVSVKIELYKGTAYYMTICSQTSTTVNSYTWTPAWYIAAGSEYRVKVTSISTAVSAYDFSDANFSIHAGTIAVTTPNGGETWQGGTPRTILWTSTLCDNVRIELWKGGVFKSLITSSTPASTGSYTWAVPTNVLAGTDYKVKIMSASSATGTTNMVYDFSDNYFAFINPLVLTVVTPNGGEIWTSGNTYPINWIDNIPQNVRIELWKAGVFNSVIATSAGSPFNWTIPASSVPGGDYKIKIKGLTNTASYDFSDNYFTIGMGSYITVTSPNGGENWHIGCPYAIQWSTATPVPVRIDLYKGTAYYMTIGYQTNSSVNSYTWTPPWSLIPGSEFRVKITSLSTTVSAYDFSDANFSILAGNITVNSPNGGETWQAGTTQTILWTDNLCDNVRIELWKGGVNNSLISGSTASTGSFTWAVPSTIAPGTDYKVKIMSAATPAGSTTLVYDFSDANFAITGPVPASLTVLTPNGGENWLIGCPATIQWQTTITGSFKIELYKGSTLYTTICPQTTSISNSYTWTPPWTTAPGAEYRVKITSLSSGIMVYDFSDASFAITAGTITVTSPNGGETWQAGSTQPITWTTSLCDYVRIELWKAGVFNSTITQYSPAPGGIYTWALPSTLATGTDYKVKVMNAVNTPGTIVQVYDFSDTTFAITSPILSPIPGIAFLAYPNPCTDNLHLRITDNSRSSLDIRLVNFRGETVFMKSCDNLSRNEEFSINTSTVIRGNYFLIVHSGGETIFHTLVEIE